MVDLTKFNPDERMVIETTEEIPFYQVSVLSDFLTEQDNGVRAMERLTVFIRYGILEFSRECDINCNPDTNKISHDVYLIIPKCTRFVVYRKQGVVLNGRRKGDPCWYYYLKPDFRYMGFDVCDDNDNLYIDANDVTMESFVVV